MNRSWLWLFKNVLIWSISYQFQNNFLKEIYVLHLFLFVFFQVHCDAVCWSSWALWGSFIHVLKHIKILLWKSEECKLLLVLVINEITCFIVWSQAFYDWTNFRKHTHVDKRKFSLRHRHNLTLVSNVCKVALRSLICSPNGLNKLLMAVHFEFHFVLIGKSTMAFLTIQSWHIVKSWYTGGSPGQGFWHCFADSLTRL